MRAGLVNSRRADTVVFVATSPDAGRGLASAGSVRCTVVAMGGGAARRLGGAGSGLIFALRLATRFSASLAAPGADTPTGAWLSEACWG